MAASRSSRFLDLLRVLADHDVDFIIVGGVAGVLAGAPLVTFDLDVVFDRSPVNIPRLLAAFRQLNARYRDPAGRHIVPDVRKLERFRMNLLTTDLGDFDVLTVVRGDLGYPELLERSHEYEVSGLRVRAIDLPTLIESKEFADRPKDRYALLFLRQTLAFQQASESSASEDDPTES